MGSGVSSGIRAVVHQSRGPEPRSVQAGSELVRLREQARERACLAPGRPRAADILGEGGRANFADPVRFCEENEPGLDANT
jgi:hypothetical protein